MVQRTLPDSRTSRRQSRRHSARRLSSPAKVLIPRKEDASTIDREGCDVGGFLEHALGLEQDPERFARPPRRFRLHPEPRPSNHAFQADEFQGRWAPSPSETRTNSSTVVLASDRGERLVCQDRMPRFWGTRIRFLGSLSLSLDPAWPEVVFRLRRGSERGGDSSPGLADGGGAGSGSGRPGAAGSAWTSLGSRRLRSRVPKRRRPNPREAPRDQEHGSRDERGRIEGTSADQSPGAAAGTSGGGPSPGRGGGHRVRAPPGRLPPSGRSGRRGDGRG